MKNTLMIDAIYRQRIRAVGWSVIAKFGLIPDNCIHWRVNTEELRNSLTTSPGEVEFAWRTQLSGSFIC